MKPRERILIDLTTLDGLRTINRLIAIEMSPLIRFDNRIRKRLNNSGKPIGINEVRQYQILYAHTIRKVDILTQLLNHSFNQQK